MSIILFVYGLILFLYYSQNEIELKSIMYVISDVTEIFSNQFSSGPHPNIFRSADSQSVWGFFPPLYFK